MGPLRVVVLFGVVSLLADATYEGARSITGPFLGLLGASGAAVGLVAGLGELAGYALRLVTGWLADRTRAYWALTVGGYALNLLAVPALALVGRFELAAALLVAERVGKAVRTPARDVILARATETLGHGRGFGLHEALDQIGAVAGPLVVAAVLAAHGSHRVAFAALLVPALAALAVLVWIRGAVHEEGPASAQAARAEDGPLPRSFWLYLAAVALVGAATADFPLLAYHFARTGRLGPELIPLVYAGAMGVDALAALGVGRWFDARGIGALAAVVALASFAAPLAFLGSPAVALVGVALWGVGMGAQESVLRAAVATLVPAARRGTAYGIFHAGFGVAWFAGSATLGLLYDRSLVALAAVAVALGLAGAGALALLARRLARAGAAGEATRSR